MFGAFHRVFRKHVPYLRTSLRRLYSDSSTNPKMDLDRENRRVARNMVFIESYIIVYIN